MSDDVTTSDLNSELQEPSFPELSHSDKMAGIFTEPTATYSQTAAFPPRTIDWLLPLLLLFLLIGITNFILMKNPDISYSMKQQQVEKINELVENKKLTQEQADQQLDNINKFSDSTIGSVITFVGILVGGSIFFFLIVLIYFMVAKLFFKDDGNYSSALVAAGLPSYIVMIQVILAALLSFVFGRLINDTSVAALMNVERSSLVGWALAKIDPITIWAYFVTAIGLSRMFKSANTVKYLILVFGLWIFGSLIWTFISQSLGF
jgi:hypothetical protein